MGEARARWLRQRGRPCVCGSTKSGSDCCWTLKGWFKPPTRIDLMNTGHTGSHPRCYLKEINTCSDKISGEHVISATVLRALGEKILVSGTPWLEKGSSKEVGIGSLVSKCLCEAHNHALSGLDAVAGVFWRRLEDCFAGNAPVGVHLFSGHDLERWLLKTTLGLAASRIFASGGERLPGNFVSGVDAPKLIQNPAAWRKPQGIYVLYKKGEQFRTKNGLAIAPLGTPNMEIGGLLAEVQGFVFGLLLDATQQPTGSRFHAAPRRLQKLNINLKTGQRTIMMSWLEDQTGKR